MLHVEKCEISLTFEQFSGFLEEIHPVIQNVFWVFFLSGMIVLVYKVLMQYILRFTEKHKLDPDIGNILRYLLRVIAVILIVGMIFSVYELPSSWLVSGTTFIGAAIGLGASRTINNVVAGFYVIFTKPFKITDYVKIGDLEGQVEEISTNYTKLYTPGFELVEIPNIEVMNSRITNFIHKGFIKYTFSLGFPHTISNEDIESKCIEPAIMAFIKKHKTLRKPEYYFETHTRLGRSYKIRMFTPKGDVKILYNLQPELSNLIIKKWDDVRSHLN